MDKIVDKVIKDSIRHKNNPPDYSRYKDMTLGEAEEIAKMMVKDWVKYNSNNKK